MATAGAFRINYQVSSKGHAHVGRHQHHIDPTEYLDELLTQASRDLMRTMLTDFTNQILSAQADAICRADYHMGPSHSEPASANADGYRELFGLQVANAESTTSWSGFSAIYWPEGLAGRFLSPVVPI